MTLVAGTKLGPYEILAPLGAGGMGEVYRARDTRLAREVAVKVLSAEVSSDPERLRRFEKEARSASALNHPNIVTIFDIGSAGDVSYIAMELVGGETLRTTLLRGSLTTKKLLQIAAQVAEGLARAHEAGIVHRDLKPENLMVTKEGLVKILDFGVAKPTSREPGADEGPHSPTMTETSPGVILGTAGYMSPEQASGEPVDFRSDQFAFGSILYEMATGKRAFQGRTSVDTLAAILNEQPPPIESLNAGIPAPLRWIIERCHSKEPRGRYGSTDDLARDLATVRDRLSEATSGMVLAASRPRRRWIAALVVGVAAVAVAVVSLLRPHPSNPGLGAIRFTLDQSPRSSSFWGPSFSPDGSELVFLSNRGENGPWKIWRRPLSTTELRAIPGTENAGEPLFWSPDGRSLGFFATDKIWRVDVGGGLPVPVCDVPAWRQDEFATYAASWGRDGQIVFGTQAGDAIFRVSTSDGKPVAIVKPNRGRGETKVLWPWFLPDGRSFLYLLRREDDSGSLMLYSRDGPPRLLFPMLSRVEYTDPGFLVFVREGTLIAQRFDIGSGTLSGEPFSIADPVIYGLKSGWASFTTSRRGAIGFVTRFREPQHIVSFDRSGAANDLGPVEGSTAIAIDPDGRRILFSRMQPRTRTHNLWIMDLEKKVEARVNADATDEYDGMWLPDGKSIVYTAQRGGMVQLRRRELASGREVALLPPGVFQEADSVLPGGDRLAYTLETGTKAEMRLVSLSGDQKSWPLFETGFNQGGVRVSPDGRFIAFASDEAGTDEIFVAPIQSPGDKIRASFGGALHGVTVWSRDGSEILYASPQHQLISVPVRTTPSLLVGKPSVVFTYKEHTNWAAFDVSPDGKRILAIVDDEVSESPSLEVVLNWTSDAAAPAASGR